MKIQNPKRKKNGWYKINIEGSFFEYVKPHATWFKTNVYPNINL